MPNPERRSKLKKPDTTGSSIPHWAEAINKLSRSELKKRGKAAFAKEAPLRLFDKIGEEADVKIKGLQFLAEQDLPRYKKIYVDLQDFLDDPKLVFQKLVSVTGLYYVSILNLETGERIFGLNQTQKEVKKFILEKLEKEEISPNSQLILSEYWHNYYGGNLLINKNGDVLIELVKGKHAKLVKGEGQILMSVQTQPYTKALKFKGNLEIAAELESQLRSAVVKTLDLIPKRRVPFTKVVGRFKEPLLDNKGNEFVELPRAGYFEFILTKKKPEDEDLQAVFIDARVDDAADKYQLAEQAWEGNVREVSFEPKIKKLRN